MLYFLTFYSSKNPEKIITGFKKIKAAELIPTLIINQHIGVISEESCNNEAENSTLHHRNKLYFKVY